MLLSLRQKDIGKAYVKRLAAQMASHSSSPNPPKRVRVDPVVAEDDDFEAYLANMAKVDDEVERQEDDVINTALLHFEAGNPPPEVIRRAIMSSAPCLPPRRQWKDYFQPSNFCRLIEERGYKMTF